MPAISKDPGIDLHLVSGNYQQLTGPINKSFTPVTSIFGSMQAGKTISFFPGKVIGLYCTCWMALF